MAYALQSLIQILEQDYDHLIDGKPQIDSLLEKTYLLKDLFENSSSKEINCLESPIRDAAHKAEDIIESYIRDQILFARAPLLGLKDVIETFDSIKEETLKIVEEGKHKIQLQTATNVVSLTPVAADPSLKNRVVGFDEDVNQLTDRLTGHETKLQIIPLIGMGGIGKTTLARKLYNDLQQCFDICAWVVVSQEYDMRVTLLALLECLRNLTDKMHRESDVELGEHIHKTLKGRRYLIVVDDIWDNQAWDKMGRFFPDDCKGSRIMLATRESSVANYASSSSSPHLMHLLDEDSSWELFVEKVFGKKDCPPNLVETGRKIANNCRGLPLAISVMGGLLYVSEKTLDFWDLVEENVSSTITKHDEQFKNILSLSYNHLSNHLKPCFLYVGAFPEDYEIRASKIIKLWMAEGFLKPIPNSSMEDAAQAYLKALVDRNLLVVRRQESNGNVKTFSIHDLLRELCLKESSEENFLWSKNLGVSKDPENIRRVSANSSSEPNDIMRRASLTRSFLCIGRPLSDVASMFLLFGLLRVLDVFKLEFFTFPTEILQLVNLRYLSFSCHSALPSSISRFRNLQTLIIRRLSLFRTFALPSAFWEMTELRHIKSKETCIWYNSRNEEIPLQDKLQTLSNVQMYGFTNEVAGKIPNIRKLGLFCNVSMETVIDLASLCKLETLKCSSNMSLTTRDFLSHLTIPPLLKKLTLSFCRIPWGFMSTIGALFHLKQLKIQHSDFQGMEWTPNKPECDQTTEPKWELEGEEEFPQLEFLLIEDSNLVQWTAYSNCFQSLRHLVIRDCWSLKEIPCAIGESVSIEKIEVYESNPSVLESASQIGEDQLANGNDIQILTYSAKP